MEVRPASITVIAVLHFVFGGLGIVCVICSGISVAASGQSWMAPSGPNAADMQRLQDDMQKALESGPAFHAVQIGTIVVDLAVSLIMIVSGIGLLQLRPWGRRLSIIYAILSIGLKIFEAAYSLLFTLPLVNEFVNTHAAKSQEEQFAMNIMRMVAIAPPIVQLVCMIYPIIVLFIMSRPKVRVAFREADSFSTSPGQAPDYQS
jgi:hypothetical protein